MRRHGCPPNRRTGTEPVRRAIRYGGILAVVAGPTAGGAQWGGFLAADATLAPNHVWRGLTRMNRLTIHGAAHAGVTAPTLRIRTLRDAVLTVSDLTVSGGAFGVLEPRTPDATDLTTGREVNPWIQLAATLGRLTVTGGVAGYRYAAAPDTWESFVSFAVSYPRMTLGATRWDDHGQINGSYWETSMTLQVPFQPIPLPQLRLDPIFGTVDVGVVAGWNHGQGPDPAGVDRALFAEPGLTHVAFTFATGLLWNGVAYVEPRAHIQVSRDDNVRRINGAAPDNLRAGLVWFTLTISLLRLL